MDLVNTQSPKLKLEGTQPTCTLHGNAKHYKIQFTANDSLIKDKAAAAAGKRPRGYSSVHSVHRQLATCLCSDPAHTPSPEVAHICESATA